MIQQTNYKIIELTSAAHKHGNLNIRACGTDFFPETIFGGSSKSKGLGQQIFLKVDGFDETIKTDIPTDKISGRPRWIFRERAWVKRFVQLHKLKPGDHVRIRRIGSLEFRVSPLTDGVQSKVQITTPLSKRLNLLSLFSGCGGMDLGFEGNFKVFSPCINKHIHPDWVEKETKGQIRLKPTCFKTIFANDVMDSARRAWLPYFSKRNATHNRFHLGSIVDLVKQAGQGSSNIFPEKVDIVTGGFPCQDFSNAGKRRGFSSHRSHNGELISSNKLTVENRGALYIWMRKVIDITRPKMFVAENVKALTTLEDARETIENDFRNVGKSGYIVLSKVLHAVEYGVPQTRERIFFYGFRKSALKKSVLKILSSHHIPSELDPFPIPTHRLPDGLCIDRRIPSVTVRQVLKGLPEPEDAGFDLSQVSYSGARYYGRHCQGNIEVDLDQPGPTIRAQHHGNIEFRRLSKKHGGRRIDELDSGLRERRLTVRECARIQTFPDDYEFVRKESNSVESKLSATEGYVLVGNAVPPLLAYHLSSRLQELWPIYFRKD